MSTINLETTVGQLVTERPSRARVFEKFGIDYCCGGKVSLGEACAKKGVDPTTVVGILELLDEQPSQAEERDWSKASMGELCDNIERTHHDYLRRELPRLDAMTAKVASVHGDRHRELAEVRGVFVAFKAELEQHMAKEEQVLFPICRRLDNATEPPFSHCGSVQNPIRVMILEHDHAGDAMARMRLLTGNYTPPTDACNTYRAMLDGLEALEQDMHRHVHKENSILFPRAVETEGRLLQGSPAGT